MKKETLKSVVVLTAICLVIAAAMAITNIVTAPIIEEAQEKAEKEALYIVLPEAQNFDKLEVADLPESVSAVYRDVAGDGYAMVISAVGYDASKPMKIAVGFSNDGKITSCYVIESLGETSGIGTKVNDESFISRFVGADASLSGVDTISGATISSKGFISSIKDAFVALETIKEGDK